MFRLHNTRLRSSDEARDRLVCRPRKPRDSIDFLVRMGSRRFLSLMRRFTKPLSTALCLLLLIAPGAETTFGRCPGAPTPAWQEPQQTQTNDKTEKRKARRARKAEAAKETKPEQP